MKCKIYLCVIVNLIFFSFNTFAGEWIYSPTGNWYYQSDMGTLLQNQWVWMDTDNDGYEERYYFGENGEMLSNCKTPDGLYVNEKGEWIIAGTPQYRKVLTDNTTKAQAGIQSDANKDMATSLAKSYLSVKPFSRKNLIAEMRKKGYTLVNAIYAVDNSGADWNEQALKQLKIYLSNGKKDKEYVINCLRKEGFTDEEIDYSLNMCRIN